MKKTICMMLLAAMLLCGCGKKAGDVPDNMQLVSREDVAYCLYVPKTWNSNLDSGVSSAYYSSSDPANVSVMSYMPEAESMSIDDYWKFTEESYRANFSDYSLQSTEAVTLGGRKAGKYIFTATVGGASAQLMQVIAAYNGMFYILTYTATPETFEGHLEEVQMIVDNFTFR